MAKAIKKLGGTNVQVKFGSGGFIDKGLNAVVAAGESLNKAFREERKQHFEQSKIITDGLVSGLYSDQFTNDVMNGIGELSSMNSNSPEYAKKVAQISAKLKYNVDRQAQNTAAFDNQTTVFKKDGIGKGYYDFTKIDELRSKQIQDFGLDQTVQQIDQSTRSILNNVDYISEEGRGNMSKDYVGAQGASLVEDLSKLTERRGQTINIKDATEAHQFYTTESGISIPVFDVNDVSQNAVLNRAVSAWRDTSKAHDVVMNKYANDYVAKKEKERNKKVTSGEINPKTQKPYVPFTPAETEAMRAQGEREGLVTELGKVFPGYKNTVDRTLHNLPSQIINPTDNTPTGATGAEDLVKRFSTITNFNKDVINNSNLTVNPISEMTGIDVAPDIQGFEVSEMFNDLTVDIPTETGESETKAVYSSLIFDPTSPRDNPIFYAKRQGSDDYERIEGASIFNSIAEAMQTSDKYKDSDLTKNILTSYGPNAMNANGSINWEKVTNFDLSNYNAMQNAIADDKIMNEARLGVVNKFYQDANMTAMRTQGGQDQVDYFSALTNVAKGSPITVPKIGTVRVVSITDWPGTLWGSNGMKVTYMKPNGETAVLQAKDADVRKYLQGDSRMLFRDSNTGGLTTNDMIDITRYDDNYLTDAEKDKIQKRIEDNFPGY